ncbi:MAG: anaerobic ribonucleoside-triphosphate reductase activating protein [Ruminococcaceae bacterium]|nr:anaerobic ribonucleoside-triphosphate reductase activating protein [Oscillospiraceae bacterium]
MSEEIFAGLQKLTLLDFPGCVACTLFTKGCNMRCPFCHNALLVTQAQSQKMYKNEEILAFLKKRVGILDGIAITGGEPTLMPGLYDFIAQARSLGYRIKLDTNGTRPDVLKHLVNDGLLDYVAMDIKNCREKYGKTVGLGDDYDLAPIEESIGFLMSDRVDFEFRTTVSQTFHTEEDIVEIGKWLAGQEKFYLQQFKDSGHLIGEGIKAYDEDQMKSLLDKILPFVPNAQLRGL